MAEFAETVKPGKAVKVRSMFRVDVDSDARGARRMFEIERALGIQATYYFRLSTIDRALIAEMIGARHGSRLSFRRAFDLARRRGLRNATDGERYRSELRNEFREQLFPFRSAPACRREHRGPWRFPQPQAGRLQQRFLDRPMLDELGIVAEAYELWLVDRFRSRVADRPPPLWWRPMPPAEVLAQAGGAKSRGASAPMGARSVRQYLRRFRTGWAEAEYRLSLLRRSG